MEELLKTYAKDGVLAAIVIYLLITDRLDRKADQIFWSEFFQKNKPQDKKD